MILRAQRVLAGWAELVELGLQPHVYVEVRERTVDDSRHRAGRRVVYESEETEEEEAVRTRGA